MKRTFLLPACRQAGLFLFLNFLFLISYGQSYDPYKINKKALALYDQAIQKAQARNFKEAIDLLNRGIAIEPKYAEAFLSLGGIYGQMKNYRQSTDNYEKAFAIDSNYTNEYRLPYSINLAGQGRFTE